MINGRNRPICSVRSAPNAGPAPPSCCRPATAKPCSSISTRSRPKSSPGRTPLYCLIRPAGMAPKPWRFPATFRSCRCRRAPPNSTGRKTSGSSCVRIGCPTGFSNPSTISSTTAATLGTHSSTNLGRSCPSRDAIGQQTVTQSEDWYNSFGWQAGHLRGCGLSKGWHLRPDPDIAPVRANMDGAVHRFHRGVREERHRVNRLDLLGSVCHSLGRIPLPARDDARPLRRLCQLLHDFGGAELRVGPLVPADLERSQALFRRPHVVRHHGHGVTKAHHLMHPFDPFRLAVVHARDRAAEHRTSCHRGDLHAGDLYVDAKLRGAVDLIGGVQALGGRADQVEVFRVLELDLTWQG